jgi:hypothetical protein
MSAQLVIDIRPVEIDGKHYVGMSMNGREMEQRGPYPTAAAAEAMARELITAAQEAATKVPPRAEIANLKDNHDFVTDMARWSEGGILDQTAIKKKWHFDAATWELLGSDDELVRAIEETKIHRVRSGAAKRERAQQHIVRGVDVLSKIMDDPQANARSRVDSIKALDALADPGPQHAAAEQDRIIIRIDLGADTRAKGLESNPADILIYETAVRPNTPQELSPPRKDDGNGEPI